MKVFFETFGCRLNRAEALQQEADFLARGWTLAGGASDADVIVVRGCSVTRRAQRDCEKFIEHLRIEHPRARVVVQGCLEKSAQSRPFRLDGAGEALPTRTARAYLKVQDGCNSRCSFCIVPHFRGAARSVPAAAVLERARAFIAAGYREITVTGCNLVQYADGAMRLDGLVAALAGLDPAVRIRLGSIEPGPVAAALVETMSAHPNVCRFLHLSVQSGANRVLGAMRRPYLVRDVEALARAARAAMADIAVACDLIAGFPDETETDHLSTLSLLQRVQFAKAHVFPFSERPGTAAALMQPQLPREIRHRRARELSAAAAAARERYALRFKGRVVEVAIEDERAAAGWTGEYLWCEAADGRPVKRRELVRMRVNEVRGGELRGEVVP